MLLACHSVLFKWKVLLEYFRNDDSSGKYVRFFCFQLLDFFN